MKYDLVSSINEAINEQESWFYDTRTNEKKKRFLKDYEEKIIRTIQNQRFPELDGLHYLEINESSSYQNLIITLGGLKRGAILYCSENMVKLLSKGNDTYIEYMREPISIAFNYVYGDDIICFYEKDNKVIIRIYTNSAGKEYVKRVNAQPSLLIPDLEMTYSKDDSDSFYHAVTEFGYSFNVNCQSETYLFDWRIICKVLDDEYHQKYIDSIQPKIR